jgi:hypothetical protein
LRSRRAGISVEERLPGQRVRDRLHVLPGVFTKELGMASDMVHVAQSALATARPVGDEGRQGA